MIIIKKENYIMPLDGALPGQPITLRFEFGRFVPRRIMRGVQDTSCTLLYIPVALAALRPSMYAGAVNGIYASFALSDTERANTRAGC